MKKPGQIAVSPIPTATIDTTNWQVYHNEKYGIEIKYPGNWVITPTYPVSWTENNFLPASANSNTISFQSTDDRVSSDCRRGCPENVTVFFFPGSPDSYAAIYPHYQKKEVSLGENKFIKLYDDGVFGDPDEHYILGKNDFTIVFPSYIIRDTDNYNFMAIMGSLKFTN